MQYGTYRFTAPYLRGGTYSFEITGRRGVVRKVFDGWAVLVHTYRRYNDVHKGTDIELLHVEATEEEAQRIAREYTTGKRKLEV